MNEKAHRLATQAAVWMADARLEAVWAGRRAQALADACAQTDNLSDMEFVDVQGGRDNPHARRRRFGQDKAHYQTDGKNHTAFNHFIDIRKGPGLFDDYDGYSYFRGSARTGQFQAAEDLTGGWSRLAARWAGFKVDEGLNYWLNDEYVHIPGQSGYRRCSRAVERYAFPKDKQAYPGAQAERLARFPGAEHLGGPGRGIPYSVFFPVDNLARFWWGEYLKHPRRLELLGPVLHAVQDAGIPHHAAGTMGNWHAEYENALDRAAEADRRMPGWTHEVMAWLGAWDRRAPAPPRGNLTRRDRRKTPARNWCVSQLVTWLALQAYWEYSRTHGSFQKGFRPHPESMTRLYRQSIAMSALVLLKARREIRRG